MSTTFSIPARPEARSLDTTTTALLVVDMQNAYLSRGGYYDLLGVDISGAPELIKRVNGVVAASRAAGIPVIFFQNGFAPDLRDAGGPGSPNWYKSNALRLMRERRELAGTLLTRGSWDYALADEITPEPGELVIEKPRYSGFWGTNLDMILRGRGTRTLVFTGIASNVCVESTLRDAFFLEYFPLLIADASLQAGPPAVHEAVLYNVATFFGWVCTSEEYVRGLETPVAP
jgi:ureidoacrylate peracid hydrolase